MQHVVAELGGRFERLALPEPDAFVWPGLPWGRFDQPLTPAFWTSQAWMAAPLGVEDYRLGRCLREEVVYCVLGGHGAPAEIGLAAARRVCEALQEVGRRQISEAILLGLLSEPLQVRGRQVRYRFARQRSRYLAGALENFREEDYAALDDTGLRDALCMLPGIGPKTASWIVRNRRASDAVAVLDVHIVRACRAIGVFPEEADPARCYADLEHRFLAFCAATGSRASAMDATMWSTMRRLSRSLLQQLVDQVRDFAQLPGLEQRGNTHVGIQGNA